MCKVMFKAVFGLALMSPALANHAMAALNDPGIYVGIDGGWGMTNYKNDGAVDTFGTGTKNDDGIAGRILVGYDFNQNFAIEAGGTRFFKTVKFTDTPETIQTSLVDLYGKGKIPITTCFDLYAKLGVAYLYNNINNSYVGNIHSINVAFGVGAAYAITNNLATSFEWSSIAGNKQSHSYIPNANTLMLGLRYKFAC